MNNCYKCKEAGGECKDCKENAAKAAALKPAVAAFVDSVQAPAGFVKTSGRGFHGGMELWSEAQMPGSTYILLENVDAGIKIAINISDLPSQRYKKGEKLPVTNCVVDLDCNGHTAFKTETGWWATFDRRGIEDSFYLGNYGDSPAEVSRVIQEQLVKIEASKETSKKMVKIPGFGYSVHQDQLEALKKKLASGQSHNFMPSGMGTGHRVSTKRSRYATKMPAETAKFFGVTALYDETFDHD
jgi:hypothetical protein